MKQTYLGTRVTEALSQTLRHEIGRTKGRAKSIIQYLAFTAANIYLQMTEQLLTFKAFFAASAPDLLSKVTKPTG